MRIARWISGTLVTLVGVLLMTATPALQTSPDGGRADVPRLVVDPFWPKPLPHRWIVGQVAGVAVGPDDTVWIVHRPGSLTEREIGAAQDPPLGKCCLPAPPVLGFDLSGNLVQAWGGPGDDYDWPDTEHGVFVDRDGFVWLAGNGPEDRQVLKFTPDGDFVMQIGTPGPEMDSNDQQNLGRPADVFVDHLAHEVYVADGYGNRRVIVFDAATGDYKRHWGAYGRRPRDASVPPYAPSAPPAQQFRTPAHCVQVSHDRLVYVCDRVSNRYQVFTTEGQFVEEAFFERETRLNGSVSDLALSHDPDQAFFFMVDSVNNELRVVDRQTHEVVGRVGRPGRWAGQFHVVHNVASDSQGNVYTSEVNTGQRVQKFRRLDQP